MPAAGTRRIARRWIAAPPRPCRTSKRYRAVFQELFELIDRANPVLHAFGGKGFRPASNVCDEIFSPSFRTAFVAYGIVGNKLEHAFGQNVVYQVVDMELAFLIVNLRTIVEETIVALREGVLVQVVVLAHPCFGNLKNLAVHNFKFLIC